MEEQVAGGVTDMNDKERKTAWILERVKQLYINTYGSDDGFDIWLTSPLSRQERNIAFCLADDDCQEVIGL